MKDKQLSINENGYSVRCKLFSADNERTFENVVIATYGFGGHKENKSVAKFADKIISKYKGFAVITFDWPAHGSDALKKFTVPECMEYISLVIDYAKNQLEAKNLYMYSTSFGGYVVLRYIAEVGNPFEKIALRCPGIDMFGIMDSRVTDAERDVLARGKKIERGRDRKVELDREFYEDMQTHDVRKYEYLNFADDILVLHGTKDDTVPIEDSRVFCDDNVIEFIAVENANHPFSNPNHMDFAIGEIVKFFAPSK